MSLFLGLLAFVAQPQAITTPPATTIVQNSAATDAARAWLALIDRADWAGSYRGTGAAFRKLNSLTSWSDASEQVRAQFGAAGTRTLISQEEVPAPPRGYILVRFRTDFTNKPGAIETVTLDREDGVWRVFGVTVE